MPCSLLIIAAWTMLTVLVVLVGNAQANSKKPTLKLMRKEPPSPNGRDQSNIANIDALPSAASAAPQIDPLTKVRTTQLSSCACRVVPNFAEPGLQSFLQLSVS